MITQAIEIASIASSNLRECVWSGGNLIWPLSSFMWSSASVGNDPAGQPAVLPVQPVHEHRHHHDDADPREHHVRAGGAGALLTVGAARPERHEAGAVLV